MKHETFTANRLNLETGRWEYTPRFVVIERGRLISQDCATCGQSIDIGHARCTNCQIQAKQSTTTTSK